MNFLDISPYVFGDSGLTWYSVFVLSGAILVLIISNWLYKKDPESKKCPDLVFNTFLIGFPMGLVGARIWFIFSELEYYLENPLSMLKVWEGGLAIQGGVVLGAICGIWYAVHAIRKYNIKLSIFRLMDMIIPNILIAQVVGRWGNFFNREVYGACVNREDIWFIPDFIANNMRGGLVSNIYVDCASNQYAQPLFLYEGLLNLFGFILISVILRKFFTKRVDGTLSGLYLIYYGIVRASLEGLRNEVFIMRWGKVSQSVVTSIIYIIMGVIFITYLYLDHYGKFDKLKQKRRERILAGVEDTLLEEKQEAKENESTLIEIKEEIKENKQEEKIETKTEIKVDKTKKAPIKKVTKKVETTTKKTQTKKAPAKTKASATKTKSTKKSVTKEGDK